MISSKYFLWAFIGVILVPTAYSQCLFGKNLGKAFLAQATRAVGFDYDNGLPDPLPFNLSFVDGNFEFLGLIALAGDLIVRDGVVTGLSEIEPVLECIIDQKVIPVTLRVYTSPIAVVGDHDMNLNVTLLENPMSSISGRGELDAEIVEAFLEVNLKVVVDDTDHFKIQDLEMDLSFTCVAINMENAVLDGVEVEWSSFSAGLKCEFDNLWASIKDNIAGLLQSIGNLLTSNCTTKDLLDGNLDCVGSLGLLNLAPEFVARQSLMKLLKFPNMAKNACPAPVPPTEPTKATCEVIYDPPTTTPSSATAIRISAIFYILSFLSRCF